MNGCFPRLYIDLGTIAGNAAVMRREMTARGMTVCGVAKVGGRFCCHCKRPLHTGDTPSFRLRYEGLMHCFAGRHVSVEYC